MKPVGWLLFGAIFFLGVFSYDLRKWLGSRLEARAVEQMQGNTVIWDGIAIVSMLAGLSVLVLLFQFIAWWQVILLWIGCGLIGGFAAKPLRAIDVKIALAVERFSHLATTGLAIFIWLNR